MNHIINDQKQKSIAVGDGNGLSLIKSWKDQKKKKKKVKENI